MRNGADRTTQAAFGVGIGAVAAASEGFNHAGNFAAAVIQSNMSPGFKFLYLLTLPMPIICAVLAAKSGAHFEGILKAFGAGMLGWPIVVSILYWIVKKSEGSYELTKVETALEKYNQQFGVNYGCDYNRCYYDKDNASVAPVYIFAPDAFNLFLNNVEKAKINGNNIKDKDVDPSGTKTCPACGTVCPAHVRTCRICPRDF